ncbi:MAG TPA: hypothetical protein VJ801_13180 [Polyangia bacterium]|jgi:hypothetical protein|nr:hypothetical protein [Polyangia bacterium]
MSRIFVVAILCLSCGFRTALNDTQARDGWMPSPKRDPVIADPAVADTLNSVDADRGLADRGIPADASVDGDGPGTCSPLSVTPLPEPSYAACPASSAFASCAANDVGAVVARSTACVDAWGAVPFQCVGWPSLKATEEFVVLTVPDCMGSVWIEAASACEDRIEIRYVIMGTCGACDDKRSNMRIFSLPLDPRPVIATGRIEIPPCIP